MTALSCDNKQLFDVLIYHQRGGRKYERLDDPFDLRFGCFLSDLARVNEDNRPPSLPARIMRYLACRNKFF
jgi:hypothetical protein